MHTATIETLELGKLADFSLQRFKRGAFVLARMDQHRHLVAERNVRELARWIVEKRAAGERQRAYDTIAQRIMDHRRATA